MEPAAHALLATIAAERGDPAAAHVHLAAATEGARALGRRHRQLVEIAGLVVAGRHERAVGLAAEHLQRFPEDTEVLDAMTSPVRGRC